MSDKYKIFDGHDAYFVTFTIVKWIKVLDDDNYKRIVLDAIRYYQKYKNLIVYGYCIMPNHVHMIIQAGGKFTVSEIMRDIKKFTSRTIVSKLEQEKPDGYLDMLKQFRETGWGLKRIKTNKVWQDGNRAKLLYSNKFLTEKLSYIHSNPVKKGMCSDPWDYTFSSATNYAEMESLIEVELLSI